MTNNPFSTENDEIISLPILIPDSILNGTDEGKCLFYSKLESFIDSHLKDMSDLSKSIALEKLKYIKRKLMITDTNDLDVIETASSVLGYKYLSNTTPKTATREAKAISAFKGKELYTVFVTAPMSAGKSTFLNALVGKKVCRTESQACTGQIHRLLSKPLDDGIVLLYNGHYLFNPDDEILLEADTDSGSEVTVATWFDGFLGGEKVLFADSPGINSATHHEHGEITKTFLKENKPDLILFLINITNFGTDDESTYLRYIKENCPNTSVVFIVNKMSNIHPEDESIDGVLGNVRGYLKGFGFNDPVICPVDSLAGYTAKRVIAGVELDRSSRYEYMHLCNRFSDYSLQQWYSKKPFLYRTVNRENEDEQLLFDCGLAQVEKFIVSLIKKKIAPPREPALPKKKSKKTKRKKRK